MRFKVIKNQVNEYTLVFLSFILSQSLTVWCRTRGESKRWPLGLVGGFSQESYLRLFLHHDGGRFKYVGDRRENWTIHSRKFSIRTYLKRRFNTAIGLVVAAHFTVKRWYASRSFFFYPLVNVHHFEIVMPGWISSPRYVLMRLLKHFDRRTGIAPILLVLFVEMYLERMRVWAAGVCGFNP